MPALRGSHTRRSGDGEAALAFDGQVSRRSLLSKAGAAAVAAVAAGTLLGSPRQAKAYTITNDIDADFVSAHYISAELHDQLAMAVSATSTGDNPSIHGANFGSGPGVSGYSELGSGVKGVGDTGV